MPVGVNTQVWLGIKHKHGLLTHMQAGVHDSARSRTCYRMPLALMQSMQNGQPHHQHFNMLLSSYETAEGQGRALKSWDDKHLMLHRKEAGQQRLRPTLMQSVQDNNHSPAAQQPCMHGTSTAASIYRWRAVPANGSLDLVHQC